MGFLPSQFHATICAISSEMIHFLGEENKKTCFFM
jgi:hypothetical protein